MRTVEVEHYSLKRRKEKYEGSVSIPPGDLEIINYLNEVELLVISPIDISEPTLMVNGDDVLVERHKYTCDEFKNEDYTVERIPSNETIKLGSDEEIRIYKKTGRRSGKELWVWINSDENDGGYSETTPDPSTNVPVII